MCEMVRAQEQISSKGTSKCSPKTYYKHVDSPKSVDLNVASKGLGCFGKVMLATLWNRCVPRDLFDQCRMWEFLSARAGEDKRSGGTGDDGGYPFVSP